MFGRITTLLNWFFALFSNDEYLIINILPKLLIMKYKFDRVINIYIVIMLVKV